MYRFTISALLFFVLFVPTGCKKPVEAAAPGSLSVVQGNLQVAAAGTQLPVTVILRVRGTDGAPIEGEPVSLAVTQGGGSVDPATALTDANGEVKIKWTLGAGATNQTITASVRGLDPINLIAIGVLPTDITIVQGNNQTGKVNAQLVVPIVVRLTGGPNNVPIPGVAVTLAVSGGLLTPATAITNSAGEVTVRWTLGSVVGAYTAQVSALALKAVTLSATATP